MKGTQTMVPEAIVSDSTQWTMPVSNHGIQKRITFLKYSKVKPNILIYLYIIIYTYNSIYIYTIIYI